MEKMNKIFLPIVIALGVLILAFLALTIGVAVVGNPSIKESKGKDVVVEETEDGGSNDTSYITDYALPDFSSANSNAELPAEEETEEVESALENPDAFIIVVSGDVALTEADLEGLTAQELTYARNEIYARHGRVFESSELNTYFQGKTWYVANEEFVDTDLSELEIANAEFIQQYQNDNELGYEVQ